MTTLGDLARLIRSKNAGPFVLTFDIMFDDKADYLRVRDSGVVTKERSPRRASRCGKGKSIFAMSGS